MGKDHNLKTTAMFVESSKNMHGDKYDYSKTVYVRNDNKVIIICNTCNTEFQQTPTCHIAKNSKGGCPVCSKLSRIESNKAWIAGNNKANEEAMNTEIPYKHYQLHDIKKMYIH